MKRGVSKRKCKSKQQRDKNIWRKEAPYGQKIYRKTTGCSQANALKYQQYDGRYRNDECSEHIIPSSVPQRSCDTEYRKRRNKHENKIWFNECAYEQCACCEGDK